MSLLSLHAPPLPYYIACASACFAPGQRHPARRSMGIFDLLIVKTGCLFIGEEERQYALDAGQAFILLPDQYHYATQPCQEETQFSWLHFQTTGAWEVDGQGRHSHIDLSAYRGRPGEDLSDAITNTEPFVMQLPQLCVLEQPATIYALLESLEELGQQPQALARWKQQMLFQNLLQELSREYKPASDPASQVAEQLAAFLRQHYREELSYALLKEALHFHPTYLSRCMRRIFGCTPLEYLLNWRIEQSKQLLLQTNLPVGQIANEVGFHHLSYFIRCFTRHEGMTPQVFRKQFHIVGQTKTFRSL